LGYFTDLIGYWRDGFDWREQERRLNEFDQFKTVLDGLDTHFIHQRSPEPNATPLIITHGWPGSIAEFTKIIGPLTDPVAHGGSADDAFHVVAPSMPGYGFSDKPTERGFGPEQIADVGAQLMARLGYDRYGIQGGDWGAIISRWHAFNHPEQAIGLHINMLIAGPPRGVDDPTEGVPPEELERSQARSSFYNTAEAGYSAIQGTKPQTVGYALNDSPAGQAAWIVEKFRAWCDCNGDPESVFTRDELLTNIMLYWVTETATSSARLYYESRNAPTSRPMGRVEVPTGVAVFPYELFIAPRKWAEASYNLTHWTEMPRGGHFAAMEQPDLLVEDLRTFFRPLRAGN
jgi:pimeloyl-ACP methyl ester carboxylesterase